MVFNGFRAWDTWDRSIEILSQVTWLFWDFRIDVHRMDQGFSRTVEQGIK